MTWDFLLSREKTLHEIPRNPKVLLLETWRGNEWGGIAMNIRVHLKILSLKLDSQQPGSLLIIREDPKYHHSVEDISPSRV